MHIAIDTKILYKCDNKFYTPSERKFFKINDLFFDIRDCQYKVIESHNDIIGMSFVDSELYIILEEVKENLNA